MSHVHLKQQLAFKSMVSFFYKEFGMIVQLFFT